MSDFNPFYIDSSINSCMEEFERTLINNFDVRKGMSLIQHLGNHNYCRNEAYNLMSYLWLDLVALERNEHADLVRNSQRKLEKQKVKSFNDIDLKEWLPIARSVNKK